jgi:hypothetical protein
MNVSYTKRAIAPPKLNKNITFAFYFANYDESNLINKGMISEYFSFSLIAINFTQESSTTDIILIIPCTNNSFFDGTES